jgi:hypothetical protein
MNNIILEKKFDDFKSIGLILKKVSRKLGYRKRYSRLTSNQQVQSRKLKKIIKVLLFKINIDGNNCENLDELERMLEVVTIKYYSITTMVDIGPLDRPKRLDRTIDSFNEPECFIFFKFNLDDLPRLRDLLKFLTILNI